MTEKRCRDCKHTRGIGFDFWCGEGHTKYEVFIGETNCPYFEYHDWSKGIPSKTEKGIPSKTEKRFTIKEFSTLDAMSSLDVICDNGIELPSTTACDLLNEQHKQINTLHESRRELISANNEYRMRETELAQELSTLVDEKEQLKIRLNEEKEKALKFCRNIDTLTIENEQLKTQLQNTSAQRDEFHRGVRENANRVRKLEKENEQLKKSVKRQQSSNNECEKLIKKQQEENEELKKLLGCIRKEAIEYCEELMEKDEFIRLYKRQRDEIIEENKQLKKEKDYYKRELQKDLVCQAIIDERKTMTEKDYTNQWDMGAENTAKLLNKLDILCYTPTFITPTPIGMPYDNIYHRTSKQLKNHLRDNGFLVDSVSRSSVGDLSFYHVEFNLSDDEWEYEKTSHIKIRKLLGIKRVGLVDFYEQDGMIHEVILVSVKELNDKYLKDGNLVFDGGLND